MLDEININLIIGLYSVISSIIFWIVSIKRRMLITWAIAFTFFAIGSLFIYFQIFKSEFRLLGQILFALSIICIQIPVYYEYYIQFIKKLRKFLIIGLSVISLLLISIFLPFSSILVRIQIFNLILLLLCLIVFYRLYALNHTPTYLLMFLTMIGAAFTMFSKILFSLYELQGIWDLGYISNSVFITFIMLTALISFFEERLIKSEKNYRNMYNQTELYKDIFTHDINNILQNIQSSTDLLRLSLTNHLDEKSEEMIEKIGYQILRGKDLGKNVRKLSEILNKKIEVIEIEIISVIEKVISILKNTYEKELIEITFDAKENKYYVLADKTIVDIFYNIMSNAIRHNLNKIKCIELIISRETIDKKPYIKIQIRDNGIGIPDKYKELILNPHDNNHGYSRRGLGLLLVREVINKYDGKFWIKNKNNKDVTQGSNFIIIFHEARIL